MYSSYVYVTMQVCKNQPCQRTKTATLFQLCCVITHVLTSYGNKVKFTPHAQKFMEDLLKLTE